MRHLSATEAQGHLDLITFTKKFVHGPHFHIIIMMINIGAHLDLFDLNDFLLFAGFVSLFLRLVLELAVVEDFADRGLCLWRNLHQIQAGVVRAVQGIINADDADILSRFVNEADGINFDPFVYPRPGLGWRRIWIKSSSDSRNLPNYSMVRLTEIDGTRNSTSFKLHNSIQLVNKAPISRNDQAVNRHYQ